MKAGMLRTIMILAIAAGSFFVSAAQGMPVGDLKEASLAFMAGESMDFTMHYSWGNINTDIGTASVKLEKTVLDGRNVFHCTASGRTSRFWDIFFKVREDFQTWFTCDGFIPLRFTRDTHEGKYVAKNTYTYDWSASPAVIDADVYSTSSGQRNVKLPLDRNTYDLPALFFYARNMDFDKLTPGEKHPMTFAVDDDVYHVYFILHGRETIKVKGLGEVRTVKFSAKLIAGEIFKGDADIDIYVTDDENRIPVFFEAPILYGRVSGRLASYSGLKHESDAITK